jgi:hypothetical protein
MTNIPKLLESRERVAPQPRPRPAPRGRPVSGVIHGLPEPFWEVRVHDLSRSPSITGLCVGYESGEWRAEQFAQYLMEWLPDFALTYSELAGLHSGNVVQLMREAASKVYKSAKFRNRGEFGELILHAAVRQVFNSLPAISKIYYKSSRNETVKGFDAVHVVGPPENMELWIGEVKFYSKINRAISSVVRELKAHTERDYLHDEFLLIKGKIDNTSIHAQPLRRLLSRNTSLDVVFKRTCMPVLLTYDSECVASHTECTEHYSRTFEEEIRRNHAGFVKAVGNKLPKRLVIRLLLLPMHTKRALVTALDQHLRNWREL